VSAMERHLENSSYHMMDKMKAALMATGAAGTIEAEDREEPDETLAGHSSEGGGKGGHSSWDWGNGNGKGDATALAMRPRSPRRKSRSRSRNRSVHVPVHLLHEILSTLLIGEQACISATKIAKSAADCFEDGANTLGSAYKTLHKKLDGASVQVDMSASSHTLG
jgi:hypothetical protein